MIELTAIFYVLAAFVAVAWVLLPFAMFGIKPLLSEIVAQQRLTNHHLAALQSNDQSAKAAAAITSDSKKTIEVSVPWEK